MKKEEEEEIVCIPKTTDGFGCPDLNIFTLALTQRSEAFGHRSIVLCSVCTEHNTYFANRLQT